MNKMRWSDSDVRNWAEMYSHKKFPLMRMEKEMGVSHSTLSWCFRFRLPHIDYTLYQDVMERIYKNTHNL